MIDPIGSTEHQLRTKGVGKPSPQGRSASLMPLFAPGWEEGRLTILKFLSREDFYTLCLFLETFDLALFFAQDFGQTIPFGIEDLSSGSIHFAALAEQGDQLQNVPIFLRAQSWHGQMLSISLLQIVDLSASFYKAIDFLEQAGGLFPVGLELDCLLHGHEFEDAGTTHLSLKG
jgi:hypothetical protein